MSMKLLKYGIGIVLGAAAGYSYWYFVGCNSGTCAITSSPVNSSAYGAVMGAFILNILSNRKQK